MYKKAVGILMLLSFALMTCVVCVREIDAVRLCPEPVQNLKLGMWELEEAWARKARPDVDNGKKGLGIADVAVSGQRTVAFLVVEQHYLYELSDTDLEVLQRIVEAEAGNEDEDGKLLVANVVMNRVRSDRFPNTVSQVVYQRDGGRAQFSPISDGRIDRVSISQDTVEAVSRAMNGEDASAGALYFRAVNSSSGWFDQSLNRVLEYGNHIFYTM